MVCPPTPMIMLTALSGTRYSIWCELVGDEAPVDAVDESNDVADDVLDDDENSVTFRGNEDVW